MSEEPLELTHAAPPQKANRGENSLDREPPGAPKASTLLRTLIMEGLT